MQPAPDHSSDDYLYPSSAQDSDNRVDALISGSTRSEQDLDIEVNESVPETEIPSLRHNRDYMLLMSGRTMQMACSAIGGFSIWFIALAVTGEVWLAGVVVAIGEVGALAATLPAGVLADRLSRKQMIVVSAIIGAILWGGLAVMVAFNQVTPAILAIVLFIGSVITTMIGPPETGALRAVVPPAQLPQAMAAVQGRSAIAALAGGPIGGFLYGITRSLPLAVSAVGHIVVTAATAVVRGPLDSDLETARQVDPLRTLAEGLRYAWSRVPIRITILVFPFVNLFANSALVVINAYLITKGTAPLLVGLVDAAAGASMIAGAISANWLIARFRIGLMAIVGLTGFAGAFVAIAYFGTYWAFVVFLAIAIFPVPAMNAGFAAYTSATSPLEIQGRLAALTNLSGVIAAPLAPLVGAALLANLGLSWALISMAAALFVIALIFIGAKPVQEIGLPPTWKEISVSA